MLLEGIDLRMPKSEEDQKLIRGITFPTNMAASDGRIGQ